jgi:ribokinase
VFDVVTVGSATVDAFVRTGNKLFGKAHRNNCVMVPFGSKILVDDLRFEIGGGGTNTAVALSRLGLKAAYLGSVGVGNNSSMVLGLLKKEKVDTSLVQSGEGRTGFSVILDASGHDRTILTFKGNNDKLDFSRIPKQRLKAKWFYFSAMLNKSFETQKKLAAFAAKNSIKIAYNPSSYLAKKGAGYIRPILQKTELLVLNREEAAYLVGKQGINRMLKRLLKLGPKIVAVTDGARNAYVADGRKVYWTNPPNIHVVESTGAGDAFASTLLAMVMKNKTLDFALAAAVANSQSVISHYGPKNILLPYSELARKARAYKVREGVL